MNNELKFKDKVLAFNEYLSNVDVKLPDDFRFINPFRGEKKHNINIIVNLFYSKFYKDNKKRFMVIGSSPARRGTAATGIPYEDAWHLEKITGILIDDFHVNKSASNFLYDVIEKYGGCEKFYNDFYMCFACPLGIVKVNDKGNEINCNYYDNKKLQQSLYEFITHSIQKQIEFGIDRTVCYCIGSGQNYTVLSKINEQYNFFDTIIPLEHPRYIMQYNSKDKEIYFERYLKAFNMIEKTNIEGNEDYERY